MEAYPVSSVVNFPGNKGPECVEKAGKQQWVCTGRDMQL